MYCFINFIEYKFYRARLNYTVHTCLYSPIMEPFFLISDSDLSSSRLHISFSCRNTHTHIQIPLGCCRAESKDRSRVRGPWDCVTAMKCKEDREMYWQMWSSRQSHALHATCTQAHKSLTATPTHSRRETSEGQHWTHMGWWQQVCPPPQRDSSLNSWKSTWKMNRRWRVECQEYEEIWRNIDLVHVERKVYRETERDK